MFDEPHCWALARPTHSEGIARAELGPDRAPLLRERVVPAHLGEAREVGVGGADVDAVLDGERGELGVGDEVGAQLIALDELAQDLVMVLGGGRGPYELDGEPFPDALPRVVRLHR